MNVLIVVVVVVVSVTVAVNFILLFEWCGVASR